MSWFCLGRVGMEGGWGGVLTIVIAFNRASGCGLEVKWGHGGFWDFQAALGNKLSSLLQGEGPREITSEEWLVKNERDGKSVMGCNAIFPDYWSIWRVVWVRGLEAVTLSLCKAMDLYCACVDALRVGQSALQTKSGMGAQLGRRRKQKGGREVRVWSNGGCN